MSNLLLYQEWLTTRPWDILLASGIIIVVASVPVAVAIGTWIQKRRADAARRIPWLRRRARAADAARADAESLGAFGVILWVAILAVIIVFDQFVGRHASGASKGIG